MRVFINLWFKRFVKKNKIDVKELKKEIARIEKGLIDADLGGGVIKQRIATNIGKSKNYRSIILFRKNHRAFFIYGFAKNEINNITKEEEQEFKNMAIHILSLSDKQLQQLLNKSTFIEVSDEN